MFSFLSNLPLVGQHRAKQDKEYTAASSPNVAVQPESVPTPADSRIESFQRGASAALTAMSDDFDRALKKIAGQLEPGRVTMIRTQLDSTLGAASKALGEFAALKSSTALIQLQFAQSGPAGATVPASSAARLARQEQATMWAAAHAVSALNGVAQTWRSLPAPVQAQVRSELDNAQWHMRALGRDLSGSALALSLPQSANQMPPVQPGTRGCSAEEIRAMVFHAAADLSPPLQADVAKLTSNLGRLLSEPAFACAPANERHGIPAGDYLLPVGATMTRTTPEEWSDTAIPAFAKDVARDIISGGVLTIDGHNAVSGTTFDACRSLRQASVATGDEAARSAASAAYLDRCNDAGTEAVGAIRAAVPPELAETVLGVATQRSLLELNAQFAANCLGWASSGMDTQRSGQLNFAIRTEASHGRPGVVEIDAWKDCRITGLVGLAGDAVAFDSPQLVRLSGTFEVSADGVRIATASAQVHGAT